MLTQEVKTEIAALKMFLLPSIGTQIHMCCRHEGDAERRRDGGGKEGGRKGDGGRVGGAGGRGESQRSRDHEKKYREAARGLVHLQTSPTSTNLHFLKQIKCRASKTSSYFSRSVMLAHSQFSNIHLFLEILLPRFLWGGGRVGIQRIESCIP